MLVVLQFLAKNLTSSSVRERVCVRIGADSKAKQQESLATLPPCSHTPEQQRLRALTCAGVPSTRASGQPFEKLRRAGSGQVRVTVGLELL